MWLFFICLALIISIKHVGSFACYLNNGFVLLLQQFTHSLFTTHCRFHFLRCFDLAVCTFGFAWLCFCRLIRVFVHARTLAALTESSHFYVFNFFTTTNTQMQSGTIALHSIFFVHIHKNALTQLITFQTNAHLPRKCMIHSQQHSCFDQIHFFLRPDEKIEK